MIDPLCMEAASFIYPCGNKKLRPACFTYAAIIIIAHLKWAWA